MIRSTLLLAISALSVCSFAKIEYRVEPNIGGSGLLITMTVPPGDGDLRLGMPRWAPGSYRYADNSRRIMGVVARDADGTPLEVGKDGDHFWVVKTGNGATRVSYSVAGSTVGTVGHFSGPSTYMYVDGRINERTVLRLVMPEGWDSACGLKEVGPNVYSAPDYDVLADNPVTYGIYEKDTYTYQGVPHEIVYHSGPVNMVDRQAVIKISREITAQQSLFWRGLPFDKYVWHFRVTPSTDGAGGLEHLSSTQISFAAGLGYGAVGVLSHEYFHAWNVKRIRSGVLGPFDYQKLPRTGALWWLEGVTDYYAHLLIRRQGYSTDEQFYRNLMSNVNRTRANSRRMEISPYDSSYKVADAANGRGNSAGFGVNYYNTGWVVGLCLDIELRAVTGGKKTLDDVSMDLWEMCKDDQPGFKEEEIRNLLVKHGGEHMGDCYDKWVMSPGELPVEAQLAKLGLEMKQVASTNPTLAGGRLRIGRNGLCTVRGAASGSGLANNSVIVGIGDVRFDKLKMADRVAAFNRVVERVNGRTVDVYLRGKDEPIKAKVGSVDTMVTKVVVKPSQTMAQKRMVDAWLSN